MTVHFMNGMLLQQELERFANREEARVVVKKKIRGLPLEFVSYFRHVKSLQHRLPPDHGRSTIAVHKIALPSSDRAKPAIIASVAL